MLITPGNSKEVMVEALQPLTPVPHTAASASVNALFGAGFGIIHVEECAKVIKDLLTIAKVAQPADIHAIDPRVIKAKAFVTILEDK